MANMEHADGMPGWDAIDDALTLLYGDQEPQHFGTVVKYAMGEPDPLDGVSAYSSTTPTPHWHFVSFGMSELYAKHSKDQSRSGWGFEFTFRLACDARDKQPPGWVGNFLQNLARYVFDTGNTFEPGHHMDLNGPIALNQRTGITAALFAEDPQLPPIRTPHGRLAFVQVVGITADELAAVRMWDAKAFLKVMGQSNPMLMTDLSRPSILSNPATADLVRQRSAAEGSSTGVVFAETVAWKKSGGELQITLGANAAEELLMLVPRRLPHGRPLTIAGAQCAIILEPAGQAGWTTRGEDAVVQLPAAPAAELARAIKPRKGTYRIRSLPGVSVMIVPSEIRDEDGNIVRTIGA